MTSPRRLVLKSETLAPLTPRELRAVAGGQDTRNCATRDCQTVGITCFLSLGGDTCP